MLIIIYTALNKVNNSITTKKLLTTLMNKKIIGKKHTPENKIIKSKTYHLNKKELKEFKEEYAYLIKNELIIKQRKRTKKDFDLHISLNPRKMKEINEYIGEN